MNSSRILIAGAMVALVLTSIGCRGAAKRAAACEAAWAERISTVEAQGAWLDEALAGERERSAILAAESKAVVSGLREVTIREGDALGFPRTLRPRVSKARMRLASMTPTRAVDDGPYLRRIRYDLEIQGDYRALTKTIKALYDQPKMLLLDRLEVNIQDARLKRATVKAQLFVYSVRLDSAPASEPPPAFVAALAGVEPPVECAGTDDAPHAARWEEARVGLEARTDDARRMAGLDRQAEELERRKGVAAEMLQRRDDNRAAFTSRADELTRKAEAAVTGLAELRFKENGDPVWR